jgi:fumarylacetoacetate (FAA) hydrolase
MLPARRRRGAARRTPESMKLATLKDGSRDGQLAVVSRDLSMAHFASGIAGTMRQLLDDWNFLSPQLEDLYATLNGGKARHAFAFDPGRCMAPLPRPAQWVDGSAYLHHAELLRRARGAELPAWLREDPLMYQGGSDDLLGPCDDAPFAGADDGIDFEAELAVATGDLDIGTGADAALDAVRLLLLVNDWTLRERVPAELAKGFGFLQSKPATAFGPVALTPDELGEAWRGGRVQATLAVRWNDREVARHDTAAGMHFHFGQLLAHLAATRRVRAGSLVGGGTVSNADPAAGRGHACIAEQRALETLEHGAPRTPWMAFGDRVRIEAFAADGTSLFGAIDQQVVPARRAE